MMELAHEDSEVIMPVMDQLCFNPCYDGIGSRSGTLGDKLLKCIRVSILVMMELAHEVFIQESMPSIHFRFNPCYDGIGS